MGKDSFDLLSMNNLADPDDMLPCIGLKNNAHYHRPDLVHIRILRHKEEHHHRTHRSPLHFHVNRLNQLGIVPLGMDSLPVLVADRHHPNKTHFHSLSHHHILRRFDKDSWYCLPDNWTHICQHYRPPLRNLVHLDIDILSHPHTRYTPYLDWAIVHMQGEDHSLKD
jgi:hypothetical protein